MKATLFLMFSFLFIIGSLFGQKNSQIFIDSDIRKQFFPITSLHSPEMKKPYLDSFKKMDSSALRDFDSIELFHDRSSFADNNARLYADVSVP